MKIRESKTFLTMHKRLENAILDYDMVKEGDHIVVALSGGKDSSMLLRLLARKKIIIRETYKLSACYIRQGFENDDEKEKYLRQFCKDLEVDLHVVERSLEKDLRESSESKSACYTCSRFRRMELFRLAQKIGAKVVAFGHHRDDFIQTLLMNMFLSSQIGSMNPNNPFFGGKMRLIRPMLYIHEYQIRKEAKETEVQSFDSGCEHSKHNNREWVKDLLKDLYKRDPAIKKSLFRSLFTYNPDYLLKKPSKGSVIK